MLRPTSRFSKMVADPHRTTDPLRETAYRKRPEDSRLASATSWACSVLRDSNLERLGVCCGPLRKEGGDQGEGGDEGTKKRHAQNRPLPENRPRSQAGARHRSFGSASLGSQRSEETCVGEESYCEKLRYLQDNWPHFHCHEGFPSQERTTGVSGQEEIANPEIFIRVQPEDRKPAAQRMRLLLVMCDNQRSEMAQ